MLDELFSKKRKVIEGPNNVALAVAVPTGPEDAFRHELSKFEDLPPEPKDSALTWWKD